MTDRSLDELGPVDYLIVEFPAGHQNFTGEGADELLRLHDAGIIRIMDILILQKGEDGTVMAQELGDLDELGELQRLEAELVADAGRGGRRPPRRRHGPGQRRRRARLREPLGGAVRLGHAPGGWPAHRQRADPHPGHHRRRRGRRGARSRRSLTCRSDQVVPDVGVIGAPVAKAAVVTAAVSPGPSPVAKAAVVGAAVGPGPSPVAKTAVVAAAVTPGRRRF